MDRNHTVRIAASLFHHRLGGHDQVELASGGEADREKAGQALRRAAGYLRREVGRNCELRYAPELHFLDDRSLERGARVEELLAQVLPPKKDES